MNHLVEEEGSCRTSSGVVYYNGMSWIQTQGSQQMICTCVNGGIGCEEWGACCVEWVGLVVLPWSYEATQLTGITAVAASTDAPYGGAGVLRRYWSSSQSI